MSQPRGAGVGGGLLFVGVIAFVGLLGARAVTGGARVAVAALTVLVVGLLAARVLRSR